jgi:hypothetical protein
MKLTDIIKYTIVVLFSILITIGIEQPGMVDFIKSVDYGAVILALVSVYTLWQEYRQHHNEGHIFPKKWVGLGTKKKAGKK